MRVPPWSLVAASTWRIVRGQGNSACWTEGFNYTYCCNPDEGPQGNILCWDFFDADTLVPCSFPAETCTEIFCHQALSLLPLRKNPGPVFLVDAKALQRHVLGLGCVNAVFDTQTCCLLDQLLGRFICHETKLPQLRHAIQKSKSVGGDPMPHDWVAALEPKWQRCSWLTFIIMLHFSCLSI